MSHRPSERQKIVTEVLSISSAKGATSQRYDMGEAYKITFIVAGGTAAASTAFAPDVSIRQSVDEAAATSTTIGSATGTLYGPSTAFQVQRAKSALITMTTASTLTETVTIHAGGGTYVLTYSTAPSTVSTALSFGSTAGSTAGTQMAAVTNSLASIINNSTIGSFLTAATISTAALRVTMDDTAINTSGVNILTTGVNLTPAYEQYQTIIEVLSEDLNATSKYAYAVVSSASTGVQVAITAIKSGMRQQPPAILGQQVKST